MTRGGFDLDVTVRGDRDVLRALRALPGDAQREMRQGAVRLSRQLAAFIRAAGRADSRQSARAARTVRTATDGFNPSVVAGPHPLLFGSEFGALGRFGWYSRSRYAGSPARQFRTHRGSASYWFFEAANRADPIIAAELEETSSAIIRAWSA
jgi:hypothetical protein